MDAKPAPVPSAPALPQNTTPIRRQGTMLPGYEGVRSDRPPIYTSGREGCRLNVLSLGMCPILSP